MKSLILSYELSKIDHYQKVLFNRKLFGFTDNSNKCKYQYKREGILKKADYIKLGRGAIVIKIKDKDKITKLFRKFKVEYDSIPATISQYHFSYY
ncbi:MAG: hypothetical protein Q8N99_08330 [Nanoarchaeota archaeon]|nr:hypothetical protein [Nanoarchaeota archaeon]